MTPADLLLALARSGLSRAGLARLIGVTDRTVNRWINGERAVLPEAADALHELIAAQERAADEAEKLYREHPADEMPVLIYRDADHDPKWTGFPCASAHLAVVVLLAARGLPVKPVLFDRADYRAHLGKRPDTRRMGGIGLNREYSIPPHFLTPYAKVW